MFTQSEIDKFLDRQHTIRVVEHPKYKIPQTIPCYSDLHNLMKFGFPITVRELIHAIGCKWSALPMSEQDECLRAGNIFLHLLDIGANSLCFRKIDRDRQRYFSEAIGIGVTCLIASKVFAIDWDQLGPIPEKGKIFDYRAPIAKNMKGMFEAKGTNNYYYQSVQIENGHKKKIAHHNRGEKYDVELIVSTFIGRRGNFPRILLADPQSNILQTAFGPKSNKFYRYRHYAHILQFIGLPLLGRLYYSFSNQIIQGKVLVNKNEFIKKLQKPKRFDSVFYHDMEFIGKWFGSWVPESSKRYMHLESIESEIISDKPRYKVFQGVNKEIFNSIIKGEPEKIQLMTWDQCVKYTTIKDDMKASLFPDHSLMIFRIS